LNINDKVIGGFRDLYVYELIIRICEETDLKLYERYTWWKKNALPTSGNRLNDWMEYIFHFTKSPKIKARVDNVREPYADSTIKRYKSPVAFNEKVDENGLTTTDDGKMVTENPLGKKPSTVFRFNNAGVLKGETAGKHPAPFHPDLLEFFIKFLTDPGDIVLDPFMGSGTVAEVCKKYDRNWIGFELNESYGELIDIRVNKSVKDEEFVKAELIRLSTPPTPKIRKIKNVETDETSDKDDDSSEIFLNEMNGSNVPYIPLKDHTIDEIKEEYKEEYKDKESKSGPIVDDPDWFDKL
jgi:DNA modification methylase